jgi:hypothetical protein
MNIDSKVQQALRITPQHHDFVPHKLTNKVAAAQIFQNQN